MRKEKTMDRFEYIRAKSINDAIGLINEAGIKSRPLAGGTDLLVQRRLEEPDYDRLVDISEIDELRTINEKDGEILIGACVTFNEAINSEIIRKQIPFLTEACQSVGSPQIRNQGTLGGNIANAAVCADSLPVLVSLDAFAHLGSLNGERTVSVAELVKGPHETQIKPGELLTHYSIATPPENAHSHFVKIGRRNAQSISRLSIAAIGTTNTAGEINFIHLAAGAATPQVGRYKIVEDFLLGKIPTKDLFVNAGGLVAASMIEITGVRWSTAYKEKAIKALTERVLNNIFNDCILKIGEFHGN
jgi:CO/xanthine dehydrogenase FAD-binding subunit